MITLLLLLICGISSGYTQPNPNVDDFIIGTDLSAVKKILVNGGVYKVGGQAVDVFDAFKTRNYNYVRLRLFHTPNGEGAVCNSLDYTIALAKTVKSKGFKLLLDFHYSDTWADPGKQIKPAAWANLDFTTLNDSVYQYTKKVLNRFYAEGLTPDMVQTGNEINNGMLAPSGAIWNNGVLNYENLAALLKSAINGVRASNGGTKIPVMLHAATGGSASATSGFIDGLVKYGVEFQVIGLSYYPCWHGSLSDLENNINYLSSHYSYKIIIAETSYQSDGTSPDYCKLDQMPFPYTEQGQYDFLQTVYAILKKYDHTEGLYYWGGEYIYAGDIGGSWSSLFHWQGNALQALDAFNDLISTTPVTEFNTNSTRIFPNPANSTFNIELPGTRKAIISIYDTKGNLVISKKYIGGILTVHAKGVLNLGIYIVKCKTNSGAMYSSQLVIE